ncbi:MAG TPA: hypothetical protein VIJ92_16125 [Ginsengibacter sp.]
MKTPPGHQVEALHTTKRLAAMLADMQILIFSNAVSRPGQTFIIEHLYLSSSIVFQLG